MNVYREVSRELATGDRLQFSAQHKELGIANRDMGTVTKIEPNSLTYAWTAKEGRSISLNPKEFRQFDHGYAVTSHGSQGLTAHRVIAHFDTDANRSLRNNRLAYVAFSRAAEDARIYTNNAETLGQRLATDATKTATLDVTARTSLDLSSKETADSPASYITHEFEDHKAAKTFDQDVQPKLHFGKFIDKALTLASESAPVQIRVKYAATLITTGGQSSAGRVQLHVYNNRDCRLAATVADYAACPEKSIMVVPNRVERDVPTQLVRADLYAQGRLSREAYPVSVLVEKALENKMRVESYAPGDEIHYRRGSHLDGIPNDSQATVISTKPKANLLTVRLDATREEVTYIPSEFRARTRESRVYRKEVRESRKANASALQAVTRGWVYVWTTSGP